jgi:DNA-binding response OmpR family regulator
MKDKPRILYVEDDDYLSYVTKDNLELKGYEIILCRDGEEAVRMFSSHDFDLCILDVMLPEMDGFTLARQIREQDEHIPILFLSARSLKEDRIHGLTIGGDDYITKPFSIDELALKIEVFLRRGRVMNSDRKKGEYNLGEYRFIPLNMELVHPKGTNRLTSRETELLKLFIRNINTVMKKEDILKEVWGSDSYFNSRSLDVFISKLRKHLALDPRVQINNIHGIGFILVVND